MTQQAIWREQAGEVLLSCGPLSAVLSECGLRRLTWNGEPAPGAVLSIKTPSGPLSPASETYVRGSDYVSTHEATDAFPFRTQLAWSAEQSDEGVRVTLTASLQTDLLDTNPVLLFESEAPAAERVHAWEEEALCFRSSVSPTLLVTPHPSDAIECEPITDGAKGLLRLSPPFLEKGVIRRCRVAAIWLNAEATDEAIAAAIENFAATPVPLAT